MLSEERMVMALDFVTEGASARAERDRSEVFRTQAFRSATTKVRTDAQSWVRGDGVQGFGVGEKVSKGRKAQELSLRVYVDKKKPKAQLSSPVPKHVTLPELGRVQTDVLEIGRLAKELHTTRVRPAMPGSSLGHPDLDGYGTFGCVVRRRDDTKIYILSNAHVLADEGAAHIGDEIVQQGAGVGGVVPEDVIGTLSDFVPFDYTDDGFPNDMDVAIARVRRKNQVVEEIRLLGFAPKGVGRVIRRGMPVKKVGATTDYTVGEVLDTAFRFSLEYKTPGHGSDFYNRDGHGELGRVGFKDQVLCTRYSEGGDSGAVILNKYDRVIGLHFAGSPSSSVFSPIRPIFKRLRLVLPD